LPKIFHVNWFRQNKDGDFLWPGFGENLRVLQWIIERCEGRMDAKETPIGFLPFPADINTTDLDISEENLQALTSIDLDQWRAEMDSVGAYLDSYGDRLPEALRLQQKAIRANLA
jgi:phosphoenolpyruvate carboxykinase (GTP)